MTKKLRRLSALITAAAMLVSAAGFSAVAADEQTAINENFENISGIGTFTGSLGGVEVTEGSGSNHYMVVSPAIDGITAFVQHEFIASENMCYETGLRFMQNGKKSDGTCILSLQNKGNDVVRIETAGGDIVMKKRDSDNVITLVKNYNANRWYSLLAVTDFVLGTVDVKVDGILIAEEENLLTSAVNFDLFYMSTKNSPGFSVDDIYVRPLQEIASITLKGEINPVVGSGMEAEYVYTVVTYDVYGLEAKNVTSISVSPMDGNVAVFQQGDRATVTFKEAAGGNTYTVSATAGEVTETLTVTPEAYVPKLSEIKIIGDFKLSSKTKKLYRYKYRIEAYDQNGVPTDDTECTFKLVAGNIGVPDTMEVDSATGEITVTGELPKDKYVYLAATSVSDPTVTATKRLTLLDAQTYADDQSRLEALTDYLDLVKELGADVYNGTPLLADAFERYGRHQAVWRDASSMGFGVTSNLAHRGTYYRVLDALYELTGEKEYKQEVDDVYQYYLDHYIDPISVMPYWGGHTAINLETGEPYTDTWIHELKTSGQYLEPFMELDSEKGSMMVKNIISNHITNWQWLEFSRHGYYRQEPTYEIDGIGWDDWQTWAIEDLDKNFGEHWPVENKYGIAFRSAGLDFVNMLGAMYKATDDPELKAAARQWGFNILQTYYRCEHPETYIGGYQSNTGGTDGLEKLDSDYPNWWDPEVYDDNIHGQLTRGDRYYNQRSQAISDWLGVTGTDREQEVKNMCLEARTSWNSSPYGEYAIYEMQFAKDLGFDDEYGAYIIDRNVKKLAKFIEIAYEPSLNEACFNLLWDGTRLDGKNVGRSPFVEKRAGYMGQDVGKTFDTDSISSSMVLAYALAYNYSKDLPGLEEERKILYSYLQNHFKHVGAGNIGDTYPGENIDVNLQFEISDGYQAIALMTLYEASGSVELLDLARRVANNIIADRVFSGLITNGGEYDPYIPLGSYGASRYIYALVMLEAVITGQEDVLPTFIPQNAVFDGEGYVHIETGYDPSKSDDTYATWFGDDCDYDGVFATDILLPENDISLSVGEKKMLEITVLPVDCSYELCYDSTNTSCAAIDYSNNSIVGIAPGTAEITISNKDKTAETVIRVTVE